MVFFTIPLFWVVFFMLLSCRSHSQYQQFLRKWIPLLWARNPRRVEFYAKPLAKLWLMDLDPAISLLLPQFPDFGRPVKFDPIDLLRSLILMADQKVFGITKWVEILRFDDVLAVLSGFEPGKTPGVGTFYDFFDRFWLEDKDVQRNRRLLLKAPLHKPRMKLKAGQKLPIKHPQIVDKLVVQAVKGREPFPLRAERLIQQVFARCFVDRSVELGLIPDPLNLVLAGDGTCIRTGASHFGVKVCDCRKNGVFNCDCKRRFADPQARWGWDSFRQRYFYGHLLYELTSVAGVYDLPVYLRFAQAQRHDAVMGVVSLAEFRQVYPHLGIGRFLGDSAHDAYAFYELLHYWHVEPFIDLNSKNKGRFRYAPPVKVNDYGIPLCPKGFVMVFCGYQKDRNRLKWRCPKVAGSRRVKNEVHCDTPCSPSPYGRTVYTKPHDDLRLFTPTPRNSKAWRAVYSLRSGSERSFSRKKKDYELERCRVIGLKAWYWRAHFGAMNQHLDAWVEHAIKGQAFDIWSQVLSESFSAA
jgi:hypothetical protein